jgi:hypothetical protein
MDMQAEMARLLAEIESALPQMTWTRSEDKRLSQEDPHARAYMGTSPDWTMSVVSFDIEPQGFPPGSRGYDGAASSRKGMVVIRLTRPLAERALAMAVAATETEKR